MKLSAPLAAASRDGVTLHSAFLNAVEDRLRQLAEDILLKKFTAQRVRLTSAERALLHECVVSADFSRFRRQRSRPITIKWTASDSHRLDRVSKQIVRRMPNLMRTIATSEAKLMIRSVKRRWQQQADHENSVRDGFNRR